MEKENTNSGSVYVTVDGHLNPVHVSMKGTGEEGFLEFMLGDVEKALKETEMPTMGMMSVSYTHLTLPTTSRV